MNKTSRIIKKPKNIFNRGKKFQVSKRNLNQFFFDDTQPNFEINVNMKLGFKNTVFSNLKCFKIFHLGKLIKLKIKKTILLIYV